MRRFPAASKLYFAAFLWFFVVSCAGECHAILIDDFSIDQFGIVTGQQAAESYFEHPGLLGGARRIGGGGVSAGVSGGQFFILPRDDFPGGAGVSWSGVRGLNNLSLDLSGDSGLEVTISDVAGSVLTLFTIKSDGFRRQHAAV